MTAPNIALPSSQIAFSEGTSLRATARIPLAAATYYRMRTTRPSRGAHDSAGRRLSAANLPATCRNPLPPRTPAPFPPMAPLSHARATATTHRPGRPMHEPGRFHARTRRLHEFTRSALARTAEREWRARPVHNRPRRCTTAPRATTRLPRRERARLHGARRGARTPHASAARRKARRERVHASPGAAMRDPGRPRATRAATCPLMTVVSAAKKRSVLLSLRSWPAGRYRDAAAVCSSVARPGNYCPCASVVAAPSQKVFALKRGVVRRPLRDFASGARFPSQACDIGLRRPRQDRE